MDMNRLIDVIEVGHLVSSKEGEKEEAKKQGQWRGGSSGHYKDGRFTGCCPRLALLRHQGIQSYNDLSTVMMFAQGMCHEKFVAEMFQKNPNITHIEEEKQITADIGGMFWSGRMDFYLHFVDNRKLILETKAIAANTMAKKIISCNAPKVKAIIQAANYKLRMDPDTEARILYGLYFQARFFKEQYKPQLREFVVEFEGDSIVVLNSHGRIDTDLTLSGLDDYYYKIQESIDDKVLPDRPVQYEVNGMSSYDECGFCDYRDACQSYDEGVTEYDEFIDLVQGV